MRPLSTANKSLPPAPKQRGPGQENLAEAAFRDAAKAAGWEVTKRGWPDFIGFKDGKIIFVEVKPTTRSNLKKEQARVMDVLSDAGLPCFKWTPKGGFMRWRQRRQASA